MDDHRTISWTSDSVYWVYVLYYHHVWFNIMFKSHSVFILGVVPYVHTLRRFVMDSLLVLVNYILSLDLVLSCLVQGTT